MINKAVIIAGEAVSYLAMNFPADDPKYAEFNKSANDLLAKLQWLYDDLKAIEHKQKASVLGEEKCPCGDCDETAGEDREFMDKCLREAVREDITPKNEITYGNPNGKMTLVYDKDKKVDLTNEFMEKMTVGPAGV
jgi:hypothetical protein